MDLLDTSMAVLEWSKLELVPSLALGVRSEMSIAVR